MAKFKNANKKSKTLMLIAKNVTKKGKIKGSNKKETKQLKLMCPHHRITKKGAVKKTLIPGGTDENGQYFVCELCKAKVYTKFFDDAKVEQTVGDMDALLQQLKFMGTASGANKVTDFAAQACVMNKHVKKSYIRTRNVLKKSGNVKKKKKNGNGNGSNVYGSWSISKK